MADRYWVGGAGTWDSSTTTRWSATSGGAGGASAPTSADNVFFNVNSNVGTGAFTVTLGSGAVCNNITISGLDGTMTLAFGGNALTVFGSWSNQATLFNTSGTFAQLIFDGATTGKTISTNGIVINASVYINNAGGAWTLGSALNLGVNTLFIDSGSFSTGTNFAVTCKSLSSTSSNTRSITLNASTITLSGDITLDALYAVDINSSTGLTFSRGTSSIILNATTPYLNVFPSLSLYNVQLSSTSLIEGYLGGANTYNNLTIATPAATSIRSVYIFDNSTIQGTLTATGTASIRRLFLRGSNGTRVTLTCTTIAAMSDVDFVDIGIAGVTLSGTRLGNVGNNSGITFPAAKTVFWNLAAGGSWSSTAWATTSGGTAAIANFPLAQDTITFNNTGLNASATVTINHNWNIGSLAMSGRTNAMTLAVSSGFAANMAGDITLGSGVTTAGPGNWEFTNRTVRTLNTAGRTIVPTTTINCYGSGGVQLLTNNATFTVGLTYNAGTFNLNNLQATMPSLFLGGGSGNLKTFAFGTGNVTLTDTGFIYSAQDNQNLTVTGTPNINVTYAGASGVTVDTGYNNTEANSLNFNFTAGTYGLTFLGFNTFFGGDAARNVNFTGYSGAWTCGINTNGTIFGNLTLSSTMTVNALSNDLYFAPSGTATINSAGKTFPGGLKMTGTGTLLLGSALTNTGFFSLEFGTLSLATFTLTCGSFDCPGIGTRTLNFGSSGSVTCTSNFSPWSSPFSGILNLAGTVSPINITTTASTGTVTVYPGAQSEANSLSFNFTGGTYTLSLFGSTSTRVRDLNFTGFSGNLSALATGATIYGSITLSSGMTLSSGTNPLTFAATSGTKTITSNGKTFDFPVTFNGIGGIWNLSGALTIGSTRLLSLTNGEINLLGFTLTTGNFNINPGSLVTLKRLNFGGSTVVISGSGTTAWLNQVPTEFIPSGTGVISMTSAVAKTFDGGSQNYGNVTLNQGGAGTLRVAGQNGFANITNTNPTASQITFTAGQITTVQSFTLSGSLGNLVSLRSSLAGTRFTLSDTSGTISVSYLNIQDSNATGGATWQALVTNGNVNAGNNLGWNFGEATGNFFLFFA